MWATGAVASLTLSIKFRQPIPITWTIPGLIYLGTLAGRFSYAELVTANLITGGIILVLGVFGVGSRIMKWLPVPIIMGMFGGSILAYITRLVTATVDDVVIAGVTVVGYLLGRFLNNSRIPPVGLAVVFGGIAVAAMRQSAPGQVVLELPSLAFAPLEISVPAVVAVSLPMVVLTMGLGNVQGLGFLVGQGYRVP